MKDVRPLVVSCRAWCRIDTAAAAGSGTPDVSEWARESHVFCAGDDGVFRPIAGEAMYRLSDEDARAVDLLLDAHGSDGNGKGNGNGHGDGSVAFQAATSMNFTQRLARVEQLLNTLSEMPAPEPSADLVARTIQAIDAGMVTTAPAAAPATAPVRANRPHA